ncbi:Tyrosine- phosphatase Lar, partial [Paramuricea clavata]
VIDGEFGYPSEKKDCALFVLQTGDVLMHSTISLARTTCKLVLRRLSLSRTSIAHVYARKSHEFLPWISAMNFCLFNAYFLVNDSENSNSRARPGNLNTESEYKRAKDNFKSVLLKLKRPILIIVFAPFGLFIGKIRCLRNSDCSCIKLAVKSTAKVCANKNERLNGFKRRSSQTPKNLVPSWNENNAGWWKSVKYLCGMDPVNHKTNEHNHTIPVSKLAEEVVVEQFIKPVIFKVVDPNQYGTVPKSSTTQALISIVHNVAKATDVTYVKQIIPIYLYPNTDQQSLRISYISKITLLGSRKIADPILDVLAKEAADDEKTSDVEEIIATGSEKARTIHCPVFLTSRFKCSFDLFNKGSSPAALLTEVSQGMNTTKTCDLCKTVGHGIPECPRSTNSNHYSQVCRQPKCGVEDCKEAIIDYCIARNQQWVLLQTTKANLVADDQTVPVRVLLDSGSQRSYITKKLADRLDLSGPTETFHVSTFGETKTQTKRMKRVNISLGPARSLVSCPVEIKALTVDTICQPLEPIALNMEANPHLANLIFTDVYPRGSAEVDILIGADYYFSFVNGPLTGRSTSNTTEMFTCVRPDPVKNILKSFWELDANGIVDEGTKLSLEENDAVCQFKRELKFDGQRYEVSLPWRENYPELCDNYNQAVKRLEKQLLRNPIRAEAYKSSINQYHEKGFAEEVKDTKAHDNDIKLVRYLPHHAVFRDDKTTTKCRVVFDASAREEDSVLLNDCVLPGPALKGSRFAYGVNGSPFLAIAAVQNHAERFVLEFPEAAKRVMDDMYVDDCLTGADDEEEAVKMQKSLTELMHRAAFNLTKWSSNTEDVLSHVEEKDRASNALIDFPNGKSGE